MQEDILSIKNEAIAQLLDATTVGDIEALRINYLGRGGTLASITKQLHTLSPDRRKDAGLVINDTKQAILALIDERKNDLAHKSNAWTDVTLPGIKPARGHLHLLTQAIDEITRVFEHIGFVRVRYPEVEWDHYAFGALNFPLNHPARDDWETFFVSAPAHNQLGSMLLTPHTSNGQVREMLRVGSPPIRMINIAKCYRRQSDVSHTMMFHQFEGLVVDTAISITNLKGTIDYFAKNFFGPDRVTRLRPYHFQFTEPSFEVDISCGICGGKGCRLCKAGWLELGGAGMVHPNVLKAGHIDPTKYSGFAFGWGVERTFMMKSGLKIDDVRQLYSTDLRFLEQF